MLLINQEALSKPAIDRLNEALAVNKPLTAAYYLKEELKLLWNQDGIDKALNFFTSRVKRAYESGLLNSESLPILECLIIPTY